MIPADFTHILQGYFTCARQLRNCPSTSEATLKFMGWARLCSGVSIVNILEKVDHGYNTTAVYDNIILISPSWLLTQPANQYSISKWCSKAFHQAATYHLDSYWCHNKYNWPSQMNGSAMENGSNHKESQSEGHQFVWILFYKTWKYICIFCNLSTLKIGSWNPSWRKTRITSSSIINIIAADDLLTEGARLSATIALTQFALEYTSFLHAKPWIPGGEISIFMSVIH